MQIDRPARRMHFLYLWIHVLGTPFWWVYNLLPCILFKELHATNFQILVFVTLKPLVSLFSIYWGEAIKQRRDRLIPNIIWARVLSLTLFFLFPFFDNPWYFIAASAIFMLLYRGTIPAWMEILKINLPANSIGKTYAAGTIIHCVGNILFGLLVGKLLDTEPQAWRWLFPLTASISFVSVFICTKINIPKDSNATIVKTASEPLQKKIVAPWKTAMEVLRNNLNFRKFQWGFMLGGSGVMITQANIPKFVIDVLHLNYAEMSLAINCCKSIGLVLSTPMWKNYLQRVNLFLFASWPPFLIFAFSMFLFLSKLHTGWLFIAYICYGIMEGGSSLAWNLSGPIFSKKEDSSSFSNVNLLSVGLRGCVVPSIGALLSYLFGFQFVILFGGLLSLYATVTLAKYGREFSAKVEPVQS